MWFVTLTSHGLDQELPMCALSYYEWLFIPYFSTWHAARNEKNAAVTIGTLFAVKHLQYIT